LVDRNLVARLELIARDVDRLAVDEAMRVLHEVTTLFARAGKSRAVREVVETALEERDHLFAGAALRVRRFRVICTELSLEDAVDAADLLLLAETHGVLAELDAALAMLARRVRPARVRALVAVAALPFEEELHVFAPAQLADRSRISRHNRPSASTSKCWKLNRFTSRALRPGLHLFLLSRTWLAPSP